MPASMSATGDGESVSEAMLARPGPQAHVVEFYDRDDHLCERVAHYLASGLRAGEPAIAFATDAHREAIARGLGARGLDVEAAAAGGRLVMLDARAALEALMVDGALSRARFREHIAGAVSEVAAAAGVRAAGGPQRIRAYGEIVDLLWWRGEHRAAMELEQLWSELGDEQPLSLLCTYALSHFQRASDREAFEAVCAAHDEVIPTERCAALASSPAQLRELGVLEQRARSLEHELARRIQLEGALRDALVREQFAREEAERALRFHEVFAGVLGHDLRNPLGAIVMGASYVARASTSEKITRSAARILSSTDRMARMIDQLLDFARIRSSSGLPLDPTPLDLAELCARARDELEAAHPESTIALDHQGSALGIWDYDRLKQVFVNLLGNAIVHGAPGHAVALRIDGRHPDHVAAEVHNAGAVAPEALAGLFEAFRGAARQHRTEGLGLGLFISRQIVRSHGGTIEAASSEADGTTIRISLPRGEAAARAAGGAAPGRGA
jgi:signal transduction histidine kinase